MKSLVVTCFVSLLAVVAACKSSDDDNSVQTGNGVNDLVVACQQRQSWPTDNSDCSLCQSAVLAPHCDCSSLKDFSGECLDQQTEWRKDCDDAIDTCVNGCAGACDCIASCYAPNATCKKAADARDGCMTAYCSTFCKPAN